LRCAGHEKRVKYPLDWTQQRYQEDPGPERKKKNDMKGTIVTGPGREARGPSNLNSKCRPTEERKMPSCSCEHTYFHQRPQKMGEVEVGSRKREKEKTGRDAYCSITPRRGIPSHNRARGRGRLARNKTSCHLC